jgi:hypothetical protein
LRERLDYGTVSSSQLDATRQERDAVTPSLTCRLCAAGYLFPTILACSEAAQPTFDPAAGSGGTAGSSAAGTGGTSGGGSSGTSATGGAGAAAGTSASGGSAGSAGNGGTNAGGAGAGGTGAGGIVSAGGSAGATGGAGAAGAAGTSGAAGGSGGATAGAGGSSGELGTGTMEGSGSSDERYATAEVSRNGVPYILITNGWGPGFGSHTVSWEGTSFIVETMMGTPGSMGQPASYPSLFCGRYSVMEVPDCGLPGTISSLTTLKTGWRWAANGNEGEYNAAYDIWIGNGTQLQGYLMVWLRDPVGQQPAGMANMEHQGVSVTNVPGVWNVWSGSVNNRPIVNWVRAEGMDSTEIEFDVMDFIRDAQTRNLMVPGDYVNSVAVGFEIWEGPVTNLESVDFYVDVN